MEIPLGNQLGNQKGKNLSNFSNVRIKEWIKIWDLPEMFCTDDGVHQILNDFYVKWGCWFGGIQSLDLIVDEWSSTGTKDNPLSILARKDIFFTNEKRTDGLKITVGPSKGADGSWQVTEDMRNCRCFYRLF